MAKRRASEAVTARKPVWIEIDDSTETDRKVYYNPGEEKVQWEPSPQDGVEKFNEENHWQWRVPSSVAITTARNSRDTKLKMARAFYERGEWEKAAAAYEKAITIGCGRQPDAMREYAHVCFVLWDMSDGDGELLKNALDATRRSFELGRNAKHPLSLLLGARLFVAVGQPDSALHLLLQILAVRYHGDKSSPERVWSLLGDLDELTVKLTTKDVAQLPPGARLSRDGRSAVLVCRKAHVIDHSSFARIEAAVLHTAWCVHGLGNSSGALQYLDYLNDVPPPGLQPWILPLLSALLMHLQGEGFKALSFMEAGQDVHAALDGAQRILSPKQWFDSSPPWASAAHALFEAGFPEIAAAAYSELARRLSAEKKQKALDELEEKKQMKQVGMHGFNSKPKVRHRPSFALPPTTNHRRKSSGKAAAGGGFGAQQGQEEDGAEEEEEDEDADTYPAEMLYRWSLAQMMGGRPTQALTTMSRLLAGSVAARYSPRYRRTAVKWKAEWAEQFAREEAAALVVGNEVRRFVGRARLGRLRQQRKEFLLNMKRNAEVLAEFLVTAKNRGQKMVFRAWRQEARASAKQKAKAIVRLQCIVRMFLGNLRARKRAKRKNDLQYAFTVGAERQEHELTKRCFRRLAANAWLEKCGRVAVKVQAVARGNSDRRRAKFERVILFMRGRSGRYLLMSVFSAWSRPKKNKKRRLAATAIQRVVRGVSGRKAAQLARMEKHREEAKVLELLRGGIMKTARRCFQALAEWPKARPGYEAAVQCQRRARGNAGRRKFMAFKVDYVKARDTLAKAVGFGTARLLKRTFRALRMELAAKVIARAWRSREARVNAQRTMNLLRRRKAKVRRFMLGALGDVATRALYAWADFSFAMHELRHDSAWKIGACWRCSCARALASELRSVRVRFEQVAGLLLRAQQLHWRRKCFRGWRLSCRSLVEGTAQELLKAALALKPFPDALWVELVELKAAVAVQGAARCWLTQVHLKDRLLEHRRRRCLLARVCGAPTLRAKVLYFREWRRIASLSAAVLRMQCALRVALAVAKMGIRKEEIERRRHLSAKVLTRLVGGRQMALTRVFLRHWQRAAFEHRNASVIVAQARKHLAWNRAKQHATAVWLFALLAWRATLVRRRGRAQAAVVAGRAWRTALARRAVGRERARAHRNEEKVAAYTATRAHRTLRSSLAHLAWEQHLRRGAALVLQCAHRCAWARTLAARRRAVERLLFELGARLSANLEASLLRRCFEALWREAVGAEAEDALLVKPNVNGGGNAGDPPRDSGRRRRRQQRQRLLPALDLAAVMTEASTVASSSLTPQHFRRRQEKKHHKQHHRWRQQQQQQQQQPVEEEEELVVPSHAALVALADASGTTEGTSSAYHEAQTRAAATGVFVWAPSPPPSSSSSSSSSPPPPLLTPAESAAVAFGASVLLVERPDPPLLARLCALLKHKLGNALLAQHRRYTQRHKQQQLGHGLAQRPAPSSSSSSSSLWLPPKDAAGSAGPGRGAGIGLGSSIGFTQHQERWEPSSSTIEQRRLRGEAEEDDEEEEAPKALKLVLTGPVLGVVHRVFNDKDAGAFSAKAEAAALDGLAAVVGECVAHGVLSSLCLSEVFLSAAAARALSVGLATRQQRQRKRRRRRRSQGLGASAGEKASAVVGRVLREGLEDREKEEDGEDKEEEGEEEGEAAVHPPLGSLEAFELKGVRGVGSLGAASLVGALCFNLGNNSTTTTHAGGDDDRGPPKEGGVAYSSPVPLYFPPWLRTVLESSKGVPPSFDVTTYVPPIANTMDSSSSSSGSSSGSRRQSLHLVKAAAASEEVSVGSLASAWLSGGRLQLPPVAAGTPPHPSLQQQRRNNPLSPPSPWRLSALTSLVLDDCFLGDDFNVACAVAALVRSGAGIVVAPPEKGRPGGAEYEEELSEAAPEGGDAAGAGAHAAAKSSSSSAPPVAVPLRTLSFARCGLGPTFVKVLADALQTAPPTCLPPADDCRKKSQRRLEAKPATSSEYTPKISKAWADLGVSWGGDGEQRSTNNEEENDDEDEEESEEGGTLQRLWLNGNPRIGDEQAGVLAAALANAPRGSQARALTSLDLSSCGLGDRGALALAQCLQTSGALQLPPPPSSSSLAGKTEEGSGGGGEEGRPPRRAAACCPRLRHLSLNGNRNVHDGGAVALGRAASDRAVVNALAHQSGNLRRAAVEATLLGQVVRSAAAFGVPTAPLPHRHPLDQPPPPLSSSSPVYAAAAAAEGSWLASARAQTLDPYCSAAYDALEDAGPLREGEKWCVAPDPSSDGAWIALRAMDSKVRAAASRRVGTGKWKFELSSQQRLGLARSEALALSCGSGGAPPHTGEALGGAAATASGAAEAVPAASKEGEVGRHSERGPESPSTPPASLPPSALRHSHARSKGDRSALVALGQETLRASSASRGHAARSSAAALSFLQVDLDGCFVSERLTKLQASASFTPSLVGASSVVVPAGTASALATLSPGRLRPRGGTK